MYHDLTQRSALSFNQPIVYIIGSQRMKNELMGRYLEIEISARCFIGKDINHALSLDESRCDRRPRLCLWDYNGRDLQSMLMEVRLYNAHDFSQCYAALFNVARDPGIEEKCLSYGVHGFFYEDGSLDIFLKGIHSICEGKLWIPENVMMQYILDSMNRDVAVSTTKAILTPRQIEILNLITKGVSNKDIAQRLCISIHTVKTHLYTIFQTINVSNRTEAAMWSAKYLSCLSQKY